MTTATTAEVQAATLDKFIKGWAEWTPESFLASWADGCTQQNLPFSSNSEIKTKPHVERFFPILMSTLTNFELDVHNVVHDVAKGKAAIYALSKADSPWGPYRNEHALFLWFDESGEKIQKIEELFDTAVMNEILPKIQQQIQGKQTPCAASSRVTGRASQRCSWYW